MTQLRESVNLAGHFVQSFHQVDKLTYCRCSTLQQQEQVASVLKYAEFRPLAIPEEF
ncbi:MAG: hypothetical protein R3E08_01590 [Thiotrichaceae bacterium]